MGVSGSERGVVARIARLASAAWAGAVDGVLPQLCPACARRVRPPAYLCASCFAAIPRLGLELCCRCLARGHEPSGCLSHPGFTVRPAWIYEERASLVVHALKYDGRDHLARGLGGELARAAAPVDGFDMVTEVPLHPARRRERGYNQSEALAAALSASARVPRLGGVLQRVRATRAQARLERAERRRNVASAFAVMEPDSMKGRNILLVDDVITTGATLDACLAALAAAGARATAVTLAWSQ